MPARARDIFDEAPLKIVPDKKAKSKLPTIPMLLVEQFNMMRQFCATAQGVLMQIEGRLREAGASHLVSVGCKSKKRPTNFHGAEGKHKATFVFTAKASTVALTDEEVELLGEHHIPVHVERTPSVWEFNNDYLADPAWRKKINEALKGFPGDVIIKTPASTKTTVNAATVDAIFTKREDVAAMLLPVVTSLGLRVGADTAAPLAIGPLLARASEIMKLPRLVSARK